MPNTLHLDPHHGGDLARAAKLLRGGGTVAFPTETVYGLGANALDAAAVARIFEAKQRPAWDPLIVHVADVSRLSEVAAVEGDLKVRVEALAKAFWPGPLTLLLPRAAGIPDSVTAGRPLVGVRVPAHPVAQELLRLALVPIAAPSANLFGRISPTMAEHVLEDLNGRIDAVIDDGETAVGVESTVLDPERMVVYRPGAVTLEQIKAVCGVAATLYVAPLDAAPQESLPSPGVGLRHYAPRAKLVLVEGTDPALQSAFDARGPRERVGVMLPDGWDFIAPEKQPAIFRWGRWTHVEELAARLFAGLRALDDRGVTVILCPVPQQPGLGQAVRDRLEKAAREG